MIGKYSRAGLFSDRPFRICGISSVRSFGDYINALVFLNSIAAQFDHSEVTFIYKEDTDFKTPLLRTVKFANFVKCPAEYPLPTIDIFSCSIPPVQLPGIEGWFERGLQSPDLVVTDSINQPPLLCSFDPVAHLRFQEDDVHALGGQLRTMGLSDTKWFCAIHSREPGYKYKPGGKNFRDAKPDKFLQLRDFVIDELGGQVVRLGHPEMTEFPLRPGFIDLSRLPESALLQAFAVSRARYLICTPSGPVALGHAFNTPTGRINAVDYWQVSARDILRTVDVLMASGEILNQEELYGRGIDKQAMMAGLSDGSIKGVAQNSFTEIRAVTDFLHRETADIEAWRLPDSQGLQSRPNTLSWPRRAVRRARFF